MPNRMYSTQRMYMNLGTNHAQNYMRMYGTLLKQKELDARAPKNQTLNASMIDRVHRAKPGCGSCGGK